MVDNWVLYFMIAEYAAIVILLLIWSYKIVYADVVLSGWLEQTRRDLRVCNYISEIEEFMNVSIPDMSADEFFRSRYYKNYILKLVEIDNERRKKNVRTDY